LPQPPLQTTESETLWRRFARLAFFNVLSNVTVPLAGLVDTAMLGRLPDIRFLAGVALATVLFDYVYWSFGFLRMATTGTTAQALGRGDEREAFDILYRSIVVALGIGTTLLLLQTPLRELGFRLLSGASEVESAGRDYFSARIWAAPVTLTNFALLGWYLGREQGAKALAMTVAANLTNVVGDYILILHYDLEARGAAWATVAGQIAMLIVGLLLLPKREPWNRSRVMSRKAMVEMFQLNRDILLRTVALLSAFAVFVNVSSILGTVLLAANTILLRILSFVAYLIDGFAFAIEGIAGHLWGAGRRAQTRQIVRIALTASALCAAILGAIVLAFPRSLLEILTTHEPTLVEAERFTPYLVAVLLLATPAYIFDGLFLGLSNGRLLRNSMIGSFLIGLVPLAIFAHRTEDPHALWIGMALFMLLRTVTLGWVAWKTLRAE